MICELHSKRQCPQLCVFSKQQNPTQESFSTCLTSVSLGVLLWQLQIQQLEVVPTITSQPHWPAVQTVWLSSASALGHKNPNQGISRAVFFSGGVLG